MPIVSGGGGGGNTTAQVVASGQVLPAAHPTGTTVDTTTFNDPTGAAGKITALVFPSEVAAVGFAQTGDTAVRVALGSEQDDGLMFGPGNGNIDVFFNRQSGGRAQISGAHGGSITVGGTDANLGAFTSSSLPFLIGSGAIQLSVGVPAVGGNVGDIYIRTDGGGVLNTIYRCTVAGAAGAATWVGIV